MMEKPTRKIFLDVGAHIGQTLQEAIKDDYLFDAIHCFEPMSEPFAALGKMAREANAKPDPQNQNVFKLGEKTIILNNFGLANISGERIVYGSGVGASLYGGDRRHEEQNIDRSLTATCAFVEASDYFRQHFVQNDLLIVKMNCEGAEVEILKNLLESGEIFKIANVMIDFDARKIKNMRTEPYKLIKRFRKQGFRNYNLHFEVMMGGTYAIRNWLESLSFAKTIIKNPYPFGLRRRMKYWFMRYIQRSIKMIAWRFNEL